MKILLSQANALKIPIADKKVHCVITSPPYYGLRDYGTAEWIDGDESCSHNPQRPDGGERADRSLPLGRGGMYKDICKCGAKRLDAQLGLEPTLQEYIDNTVLWCREVWRVLRDDGVFWLNLGDSYAGAPKGSLTDNTGALQSGARALESHFGASQINKVKASGLKPKDLMLVPHRVAIALQNDGWWVRSDIVWHKPNPMPESVTDRPTKSHEYIFLLTKSKKYYYDQDAIREELSTPIHKPGNTFHKDMIAGPNDRGGHSQWEDTKVREWGNPAGRNKRSVWTITTKPYKGAHFATFPPEIPEICIKAGTSERGVCPAKITKLRIKNELTPEQQKRLTPFLKRKGLS